MHTKWLERFKIALIEEDVTKIDVLLLDIPEFKKIDDLKMAYTLIQTAKEKFEKEKFETKLKMSKIKKAKKFLDIKESEPHLDEVY